MKLKIDFGQLCRSFLHNRNNTIKEAMTMNNPRLERVIADIEKVKDKIAEQQSRLRTLERQKTDIENGQIIALVRSERISDAELSALLKSLRSEGQGDGEVQPAISQPIRTKQEEPRNANNDEE